MRRRRWFLPKGYTLLIVTAVFLCWYVFLYGNIVAIGYFLEDYQNTHQDLLMQNENLKAELMSLVSPENLLRRAERFELGLSVPAVWPYIEINGLRGEPYTR